MKLENGLQDYYKSIGADEFGNMGAGRKAPKPDFVVRPEVLPIPPRP